MTIISAGNESSWASKPAVSMSGSQDSEQCFPDPIFSQIGGEKCAVVSITVPGPEPDKASTDLWQTNPDYDPRSSFPVQPETTLSGGGFQEATQERKQIIISRLTQRHYAGHVEVFRDWLKSKAFPPDFEHRTPRELNELLMQFYQEAETRTGHKRKASSLRIFRAGIDHHMRSEPFCWPYSLTQSSDFMGSNAILHQLENNQRETTTLLPDGTKSALAIKPEDIRRLWTSGVIGITSPKPLQRLVFLVVAVNFGITSRDFLHDLTSDMFQFYIDEPTGLEYVQCKAVRPEECQRLSKRVKCSSKKVFSLPGHVQCPVSALKLYMKRRNPACSAFFQVPNRDFVAGCSVLWYRPEAAGVNTLSRMMKEMSEEAALSVSYTNNSLRSTAPITLCNAVADCFLEHVKPCKKEAKQTVLPRNGLSGSDNTVNPRGKVVPVLPGNVNVPILSDCRKATDFTSGVILPSARSWNGERTTESNGTTNHSKEALTKPESNNVERPHVPAINESVKARALHPVLCVPQQWEIKDIITALNAGEALLLAKQQTSNRQDVQIVNCKERDDSHDDQAANMPLSTRSSRKQPDPKRLRRDPDNAQQAMNQDDIVSCMELISGIKLKMTVLEELIQGDSAPSREVFCELQQLRQRLDTILAQSHPLPCTEV